MEKENQKDNTFQIINYFQFIFFYFLFLFGVSILLFISGDGVEGGGGQMEGSKHAYLIYFPMLPGYCTEYSINGKVIQENYGADCNKDDPPCPRLYNSAEAYKC